MAVDGLACHTGLYVCVCTLKSRGAAQPGNPVPWTAGECKAALFSTAVATMPLICSRRSLLLASRSALLLGVCAWVRAAVVHVWLGGSCTCSVAGLVTLPRREIAVLGVAILYISDMGYIQPCACGSDGKGGRGGAALSKLTCGTKGVYCVLLSCGTQGPRGKWAWARACPQQQAQEDI